MLDPSGQYETGDVITWSNKLVLRNRLTEKDGKRTVELLVAPMGEIRYTLDGSEPRDGILYAEPVDIGDGEVLLRVLQRRPAWRPRSSSASLPGVKGSPD